MLTTLNYSELVWPGREAQRCGWWFGEGPHFLPLISDFLALIQANNIGTGERGCRAGLWATSHTERETEVRMRATEECIEQLGNHDSTL